MNDEDTSKDIEMNLFEFLLTTPKWLCIGIIDHHPKTKITFLIFFQRS